MHFENCSKFIRNPKMEEVLLKIPIQNQTNASEFRKFLQTLFKIPIRTKKRVKFQKFLQTFFKIPIQNQTDWHCLVLVIIKTKMDPTGMLHILEEIAELLQDLQESKGPK